MGPELWNPIRDLARWQERINRLMEEGAGGQLAQGVVLPATDVYEEDGKLVVETSLPHFNESEVEVNLARHGLEIMAGHREEQRDERRRYLMRETTAGRLYRYIELPDEAESDQAVATFDNGILRVEVPLRQQQEPKRLPIGGQRQRQGAGQSQGRGETQRTSNARQNEGRQGNSGER